MAHIQVSAGKTLLESYVKTPAVGLCELIWNAFDEDATTVSIEVENNPLGGLDLIRVVDDGNGMTRERAEAAFSRVGDSWKLAPGTRSEGDRPVHGKYGRGRYAAFSLGEAVRWKSTSRPLVGDTLVGVQVKGTRSELDRFQIEALEPASSSTGTRVVVGVVTPEAVKAFEDVPSLSQRILTEFALHLDRHKDFHIEFLGHAIEPGTVIAARASIPLDVPDVFGGATLTVIEWNLRNVDRRLYLCDAEGATQEKQVPEFTPWVQNSPPISRGTVSHITQTY